MSKYVVRLIILAAVIAGFGLAFHVHNLLYLSGEAR